MTGSITRIENPDEDGLVRPELELELEPEEESMEFLRDDGAELAVVDIDASDPADIGELTSDGLEDGCEVEMLRFRTRVSS